MHWNRKQWGVETEFKRVISEMKHVKNKSPELCEERTDAFLWHNRRICGRLAKYERLFDDPKAKPMRLCGIHARQAKRRGYKVEPIGER